MGGVRGQESVEKGWAPKSPLILCGVVCLYPVSRGMVEGVSSVPGFNGDVATIRSTEVSEGGGT